MTPRAREPICRRFMQNLWGQKKKVPPLQAGRGGSDFPPALGSPPLEAPGGAAPQRR